MRASIREIVGWLDCLSAFNYHTSITLGPPLTPGQDNDRCNEENKLGQFGGENHEANGD